MVLHRDKRAFSLVELVLVIVVSGIAIPGVVFTFYELSRKSTYDEAMTTATMLAEGELERIIQQGFGADRTGEPTEDNPGSFDDSINSIPGTNPPEYGFHGYSWYLVVHYVNSDNLDPDDLHLPDQRVATEYKRVEVRVTNNVIGSGKFVSLKTIVTNN